MRSGRSTSSSTTPGSSSARAFSSRPASELETIVVDQPAGGDGADPGRAAGMLERGRGHVVNLASVGGQDRRPRTSPPMRRSKHGVVGFTHSLRAELGARAGRLHGDLPGLHQPRSACTAGSSTWSPTRPASSSTEPPGGGRRGGGRGRSARTGPRSWSPTGATKARQPSSTPRRRRPSRGSRTARGCATSPQRFSEAREQVGDPEPAERTAQLATRRPAGTAPRRAGRAGAAMRMKTVGPGGFGRVARVHPRLARHPVALLAVARRARGDDVLPHRLAPAAARDHVVDGEAWSPRGRSTGSV